MTRSRVPSRDDQVGRILGGRYRLVALVGVGASAQVYVAEDTTLRRLVAVKLLHDGLSGDESFLKRFLAEAQAAAAMSHPHVVAVHDWGNDGVPYLVLEFLAGGSLRDLLDAGERLSVSQALLVGLEAGRGLDYAHRRGFVHRDIKPANLMFGDDARLRIADFGLARALAEAAWTEPQGAVLGTARYASPEQAKGIAVDGRSDIYSLALSLIQSVTGDVPFAGESTVSMLMARVGTDVEVPEAMGALTDVVRAATRADRDQRIDAAGWVKGLLRVAERLPAPAPLPLQRIDLDAASALVAESQIGSTVPDPAFDPTQIIDATTLVRSPETARAGAGAGIRRRRKWPLVLLAVLILLGGLGYGGREVYLRLNKHAAPALAVRSYVGDTESAARAEADRLGWLVTVTYRYQDGTAEGRVIEQSTPAGTTLKKGAPMSFVVSRGNELSPVPDLTGATKDQATQLLQAAKFTVGAVTDKPDETIAVGVVVDWASKGMSVTHGTAIDLTISSGPAPRTMPKIVGLTLDEAAAALTPLGLTIAPNPVQDFSDTVKVGQILTSNQAEGSAVAKGTAITVTVSKGPDLVKVPDLGGLSYSQAISAITKAGLSLGEGRGTLGGVVVDQSLAPGTSVKRGSPINVRFG